MATRTPNSHDAAVRRWALPVGAVALLGLGVGLLASIGDHDPVAGIAAVIESALGAGLIAMAWVIGAVGLGVWIVRGSWALGACVGVGTMLTLAHLVGLAGAFGGRSGQVVAFAPVAAGVALFVWRWWKYPPAEPVSRTMGVSPVVLVIIPALAVLIVASCLPAGSIWESEARGYDVLSYHLQLVNDWKSLGRVAPVEHNVYSFLPSYMESAFAHLDAMIWGGVGGGPGRGVGASATAAQFLHAWLAVLSALVTGRFASALLARCGIDRQGAGATLAAVMVACVPWVVVTGSLAYNEMGVLVAFGGALLAIVEGEHRAMVRGALIGGLCGVAVSCKLTSAFLCVPSVMIAILVLRPRREWIMLFAGAAIAGAGVISPWLIRNAMHGGNPVFPFATGLFGPAHWTGEQVARWRGAHRPDAGLIGRIGSLFSVGRGLAHPQWSIFALVMIAAVVMSVRAHATRAAGGLLGLMMLAMVGAWLAIGHQQSRFLLPLVVPGAAACGIAVCSLRAARWRATAQGVVGGCALVMSVHTCVIFASENEGHPDWLLVDGATWLNGSSIIGTWSALPEADRQRVWSRLPPSAATNLALATDPGAKVYLLGDATPMYFMVPTMYHTTWDASPIGDAIRAGRDPIGRLRSLGVTHILINFSELKRLGDLGWYDPAVTQAFVRDEVLTRCAVVRGWPELGVVLVALAGEDAPR
ncbi:MAG: hypothetical protein H6812_05450 [Phycisphaeraceae bacterium]|nr:hypothetical protein [Phycisphaeraceae bacterium]